MADDNVIQLRARGGGKAALSKPRRQRKSPPTGEICKRLERERSRLFRATGIVSVVAALLNENVDVKLSDINEDACQALLAAADLIRESTGIMDPGVILDASGRNYDAGGDLGELPRQSSFQED